MFNKRPIMFDPSATPPTGGAPPATPPTPATPPATPPASAAPSGPSEAEINARIEKARKEEKDKLYPEIDKLKVKLTDEKKSTDALKATVAELSNQVKAGGFDVEKLVTEVTGTAHKQFSEQFSEHTQAMAARLEKLESENRRLNLEKVRADAIRAAGGEDVLISAMVRGETAEEIQHSVAAAKKAHDDIASKYRQTSPAAGQPQANGAGAPMAPPVPPPPGGGGRPSDDIALANVRHMTPAEFAKHRENLKRQVSGRYGN